MPTLADARPESLDKSAHEAVIDFTFDEKSSTSDLKNSLKLLILEETSDKKIKNSESILGSLGLLAAGYLLISSIVGDDNARKTEGVIAGTVFGSVISTYYLHRKKALSDIYRAKQTYKRAVENQIRARREDDFQGRRNISGRG